MYWHIVHYFTVCNLKAAQMKVQHSLIQELMFYNFKLDNNTAKAIKIFAVWKLKVQLIAVQASSWLKKFCMDYKILDNQARWGRPKTMFQAIEANPMMRTKKVSGELNISVWFVTFITSTKASWASELCFTLPNYCKTHVTSGQGGGGLGTLNNDSRR